MTAKALSLLLLVYWTPAQAAAIHHYMWRAAGLDRHAASWRVSALDPCADSRLGEGLVDVTGKLRAELHRFAGTAGCIAPELQVAYLAWAFPRHYPHCAARFAGGDLAAFQRCWGDGRGH